MINSWLNVNDKKYQVNIENCVDKVADYFVKTEPFVAEYVNNIKLHFWSGF